MNATEKSDRSRPDLVNRGLRLLSAALLIYAGSAALGASSAGLWLVASGNLGGTALLLGIVLGTVSLGLLVLSFRDLKVGCATAPHAFAVTITVARTLARVGYGFLAAAALFFPVGFFLKGGSQTAAPLATVLASATAAILLLLAVAAPLVRHGRGWSLRAAWISIVAGTVAVLAETWLVLDTPWGAGRGFNWLLFGGYPLINWNLPFGLTVAATSIVLWWAYRPMDVIVKDMRARSLASPEPS